MERILNEDEKIRRAEEIYYRRNNQNVSITDKPKSKNKGNIKNRILLNLLIMLDIAVLVFFVQNKDFVFTKEFIEIVSQYNINLSEKVVNFIGSMVETKNETEENIVENSVVNEIEPIIEEVVPNELSSSINEMEIDIQNLKAAYSFIKPISGTVTSLYGARVSENPNVNGYHTGIDVATEKGTNIKASMTGIVTQVSDQGDYGNHLKIRCNNITTLYAHCSEILVKEGQIVAQGQDIATVGSTGNSTGPHLHFEIRVDNRFVDPGKIIQF